jgi:hypothetical protein
VTESLLEELRRLPDVEVAPSQWTGKPAIWIDGREIVHAHGRWIEVRLTRKRIGKVDDDRVLRRARTSDWVMVDASHEQLILDLARQAVEVNRGAH